MTSKLPFFPAAALYTLGLLAVQAHLARYGLADLGLVEVQYLTVGILVVLSMTPGICVLWMGELWLSGSNKRILIVVGTAIGILVAAMISYHLRYDVIGQVLNLNAYPYPVWFIPWDILVFNVLVVSIWALGALVAAKGFSKRMTQRMIAVFMVPVLIGYAVFFGRVVYPALSPAIGGGAPQFAIITADKSSRAVLLVHTTSSFLYFLPLSKLPETLTRRRATDRLVTDVNGPVWQALAENRVISRARAGTEVEIIGFRQDGLLKRRF